MSDPTSPAAPTGVLICGAYGTGKSSVSSPTSGRLDDLRRVPDQLRPSPDAPRVDATVDGDRPVGDVASDILRLLRW